MVVSVMCHPEKVGLLLGGAETPDRWPDSAGTKPKRLKAIFGFVNKKPQFIECLLVLIRDGRGGNSADGQLIVFTMRWVFRVAIFQEYLQCFNQVRH